jgi:riboflavin biosynthesis protein RibD
MQFQKGFQLKPGYSMGGKLARAILNPPSSIPVPRLQTPDEIWMDRALTVAMDGIGLSSPNPSVGAVIVDSKTESEIGREISSGHTQIFRKEHAERMAILSAKARGQKVEGATLYVTLEPCSHFGHQPPCADLVIESKIKRVVIGSGDPDLRVAGEGIQKLRAAGIEVVTGVLEAECQAWHYPFLRTRFATSSPSGKIMWAAKWAESSDGLLANHEGHSKWISGAASRSYTHWLRQKYDAIVVGSETFLRDRPLLTVRDCALPHHRHPHRFVLDRRGRISELGLRDAAESVSPWRVVRSFEEIEAFQPELRLQSVMVEGGSMLLKAGFERNLFDVVHVFRGAQKLAEPGAPPSKHDAPEFKKGAPDLFCCAVSQQIEDDLLQEWVKSF